MRICSLSVPRLKDEWNQTVWSANKLRCGTAATTVARLRGNSNADIDQIGIGQIADLQFQRLPFLLMESRKKAMRISLASQKLLKP